MAIFNVFRILGDLSHVASKLILMWAIHWNRSAEGVSLITQVLYILVFCTRYLDLFWTPLFGEWIYWWNFCFKVFYIASSAYIVFLMASVYARTREREKAWRFGMWCLGGAVVLAMPVNAIFQKGPLIREDPAVYLWVHEFKPSEILWTFSEILESVAVLPQLLLLRQTTVPTVIDSYYLVCLGSYRAFYILNWITRAADKEHHFDPISVIFGVIQTALYIDFAWVYWTRQRVKLRGGGIVDSDDLRRGWLVGRLVGKHRDLDDLDEEEAPGAAGAGSSSSNNNNNKRGWDRRGISVSADEWSRSEDAQPLANPDAFEDLDDDEPGPAVSNDAVHHEAVSDGSEWVDDGHPK